MKLRGFFCILFVSLPFGAARSVDFDCIEIPFNPEERPLDCDNPDHPGYDPLWCACLKTYLTNNRMGEPATIEQAMILVVAEPTMGKYLLSVPSGTLDLGGIEVGDPIGEFLIDVPIPGAPQNFYVDMGMFVTEAGADFLAFEIIVIDTNEASKEIFVYDPMDAEHAWGLIYQGTVLSYGPGKGFELEFEYVQDPAAHRPGANNTGIEQGDLISPNFSVPVMLIFPLPETKMFRLPLDTSPLEVVTLMDQLLTDPMNPVQREFFEEIDLVESVEDDFRRGDANENGSVELADAVGIIYTLFTGAGPVDCPDAADADDNGILEITDVTNVLTYLFLEGDPPVDPGPNQCGPDVNADSLEPCSYTDC